MSATAAFRYLPDASLAALGLSTDPFPPGPEDGFFYMTPELALHLEVLHNLVQYGDRLLVVVGPQGAGKTSLVDRLVDAAAERWQVCRVQGAPGTTADGLVDELLEGFGLEQRRGDAAARLDLLRAHLEALARENQVALLVVDDADRLPEQTCALLVELASQPAELAARVLLTCKPGGLALADGSASGVDAVHVVELAPFTLTQTEQYLRARLRHAGYSGETPFDDDAVRHIHETTGGYPGAMHPLASRTLASRARGSRGLGAARYRGLRPILWLVLVGVSIGVLLSRFPGLLEDDAAAPAQRSDGAPQIAVAPGARERDVGPPATPTATPTETVAPANAASETATAAGDDTPAAASAGGRVEVATSSPDGEPSVTVYPLSAPAAAEPAPAAAKAAAVSETDDAPARSVPQAAPADTALAGNVGIAAIRWPSAPSGDIPDELHDGTWLRAQEDSTYVVQLLGTREPAALGRFARDHALGASAAWFTTTHQGKPWYVLVYGLFPDRESARAAAATLPEKLRGGTPWARPMADIKARIVPADARRVGATPP